MNTHQPLYYYVGRLTFSKSPLPKGLTNTILFSETILKAETILLDFAQKYCLTGELVIENIRSNECVRKVQFNFTQF
jgi:hypothetical protein